jgi:hypothetical protein
MEESGHLHAPISLPPTPGTHRIGVWMGPKALVNTAVKRKVSDPTGSQPRLFDQPACRLVVIVFLVTAILKTKMACLDVG